MRSAIQYALAVAGEGERTEKRREDSPQVVRCAAEQGDPSNGDYK
jgi:hypothetical protein